MSSSSVTCRSLKSSLPVTNVPTGSYVAASLGLERERNNARAARDEVPRIEQRLNVLERAGVARIDCDAAMGAARLDDLAAAIEQQYRALPHEIRRDVEYSIRKEQRARDSMTIDR